MSELENTGSREGDDTPLSAWELPKRLRTALENAGIHHIVELTEWSERDLRSLPSVGPAYLTLLRRLMKCSGLRFRRTASKSTAPRQIFPARHSMRGRRFRIHQHEASPVSAAPSVTDI